MRLYDTQKWKWDSYWPQETLSASKSDSEHIWFGGKAEAVFLDLFPITLGDSGSREIFPLE